MRRRTARYGRRGEIDSLDRLRRHLLESQDLSGQLLHGLDLVGQEFPEAVLMRGAVLLGCALSPGQGQLFSERGAAIFPELPHLPYKTVRNELYSVSELLEGYERGGYTTTRDFEIFTHYDRERRNEHGTPAREALAQRLHDHSIDDVLEEFLVAHSEAGVVGIMGGHGTSRRDTYYRKVVEIAWELRRGGYLIASGGGPGIMEAANLGAWLACFSEPSAIDQALELLAPAPTFSGGEPEGTAAYLAAIESYFSAAKRVVESLEHSHRHGRDSTGVGVSLAIPTWFYGHEPTNLFGTHVAKYFSNGLREDGLLAIATGGVIYAPGSAGTMQEVFLDLAQNHYGTCVYRSPMVFLGHERFASLVALIREFVAEQGKQDLYGDLITLEEEPQAVSRFIREHPPREAPETTPLYELL